MRPCAAPPIHSGTKRAVCAWQFYFLMASVVTAVALATLNKVTDRKRATREDVKGLQQVWRNNESANPKPRSSDDILSVTDVA